MTYRMMPNSQKIVIFNHPITKIMLLLVDKKSKETVFSQIYIQIIDLINNGTLDIGAKLPSTRELARIAGVNRTTVVRVYEELWAQGYIESTPGSYTIVRKRKAVIVSKPVYKDETIIKHNLFRNTLDLDYDLMSNYLENGELLEKDKINLLQLSPDSRLLEKQQLKSCMRQVLNETNNEPFDNTHARGYHPLRQEIIKHMKLHNIHSDDKNILVTNGTLQSLQLIFQTFSKPGDFIAVEDPTNSIILLFIKIFQLKIVNIPITNEGLDLKVLKRVIRELPIRFIYVMPTFQNPTGISMPQANREEFLHICEEENCIIIEDSIEEEMKYSGKSYLPLKAIDYKGQVIYLGTFAKVLAPGLRIGWIIGDPECIKKLTVLKSIFEISSSTISQIFLYKFFKKGAYELHLRKTMRIYRKRMRVAILSIKKYIPAEKIEWKEPSGGYMIWVKILCDYKENIEKHISEYGVLVHNGKYFFVTSQRNNYIRICISQSDENEIEEGIKRLGEAILTLK
jgi:DNA-binding transcriptional MocR family regulator